MVILHIYLAIHVLVLKEDGEELLKLILVQETIALVGGIKVITLVTTFVKSHLMVQAVHLHYYPPMESPTKGVW